MKKLLYLLLLTTVGANAQVVLEQQVIGSTGSYQVGTNLTLSSTVGEAVVQTLFSTSGILTQGFQQSRIISDSLVTYELLNESCRGAENGSLFIIEVVGCPGPYQVIITAIDDSTTILKANELGTGIYNVAITSSNNCSFTTQITVGLDSESDCQLKFYSGITPNNDGKNDVWLIDNIEQFPENDIVIYNRWNEEVWSAKGYDNRTVVFTGLNDDGEELSSATYFYTANVNGKIYKGWIEITR